VSYLVNLALEGRLAVVVGGGAVAVRKAEDLLAARAQVRVVALEPCVGMRALAESGRVTGHWREYRTADLDDAFLVVAATDDRPANARIRQDAQACGILINVVDDPPLCTFTVPAVVRRGRLTLAVATGGSCPSFAAILREELDEKYGSEYAELAELMAALRREMLAQGWDGRRIKAALRALYRGGIAAALAAGDRERVRSLVRAHAGESFSILR
jgi:precorrin-2 dehydrogenase/sirohydrochlorin ferrochelatase